MAVRNPDVNKPGEPVAVLIVGAGVAGSTAAAELARRGVQPLLVGPAPNATAPSYRVLVSDRLLRRDALPRQQLSSFTVVFDSASSASWPATGLQTVWRRDLEKALLRRAQAAGTQYVEGTVTAVARQATLWRVTITAADVEQTTLARHLVLATGAHEVDGIALRQRGTRAGLGAVRAYTGLPRTAGPSCICRRPYRPIRGARRCRFECCPQTGPVHLGPSRSPRPAVRTQRPRTSCCPQPWTRWPSSTGDTRVCAQPGL
ncbi:NAD(P)/FAD-dependent oxidoreductase [Amycolatopsis sp. NPDC059021]|uniref:NAD(P)/FAD-dependent oxidoreductase n=1 Tax=Amycolatopsis sp. NPDC059021 TaxID=3346704 RepID=UPI00366D3F8C